MKLGWEKKAKTDGDTDDTCLCARVGMKEIGRNRGNRLKSINRREKEQNCEVIAVWK